MSHYTVDRSTKAAIVAEIEGHLDTLTKQTNPNDPYRNMAKQQLTSLLARVHLESNVIKAAVKKVMNLGVKKTSPAQREVTEIWAQYLRDTDLARRAAFQAHPRRHRGSLSNDNPRDYGTSIDFTRAPANQWGMHTASTTNLGHGEVYNPVHHPGHFASTPALMGGQNPQPSHEDQPQFPQQTQQPVASSSTNWGAYAISRPPSQHSAASSSNHSAPQYDGRASISAVGGMSQFIQAVEGTIQERPDGQYAFDANGRALWRRSANNFWEYVQ